MCYCPAYKDNLAQKHFEKTTWQMSVYYSNVPVLRYKKTDTQDNAFLYETQSIALFFFRSVPLESNSRRKMQLYAVQYSTVQQGRPVQNVLSFLFVFM